MKNNSDRQYENLENELPEKTNSNENGQEKSEKEFPSAPKEEGKRILQNRHGMIAERTKDMYFGGLMSE